MTKFVLLMITGSCWASFCCTMTWRYLLDTKHHSGYRWSVCDHCGHRLNAWQLIPVFGYLGQLGHCRYCNTVIDYWWPLCELTTGILWAISVQNSISVLAMTICVSSACLVISTQDYFDHCFQPIWLLAWSLMLVHNHWPRNLLIDGVQIAILIAGYYSQHIGHGDLDALIVLTIVLGSYQSTVIILAACLLTLICPALYRHQSVPFMPFLSLALLCFLVFPACSWLIC